MSKILILEAHPDDETIGCGGTIRKFHEEGHHIELLTFTDGESARGENKINRNKVTKDVAQILGINRHNYADFPDNAMDQVSFLDVVKFIEEHVDYYPDIIFTHSLNDLIIECVENNPTPVNQKGTPTINKRKLDNHLKLNCTLEHVYDQIRMLDGDDYPRTHLDIEGFRFEFSRACLSEESILTDVKIFKIDE